MKDRVSQGDKEAGNSINVTYYYYHSYTNLSQTDMGSSHSSTGKASFLIYNIALFGSAKNK